MRPPLPVTVVVADRRGTDRRACVRRLRRERGIQVVGEAQNSTEVQAAVDLKPRVLVLDVKLGSDGTRPAGSTHGSPN
jgi:DNA-binding NarL/FixJ family response regulator